MDRSLFVSCFILQDDRDKSFIKSLLVKIGPSAYDDPLESFTKLRQNETVEEYKAKFGTLSTRLRGLYDSYKLRCFLNGLRDEIRLPIRMFSPNNFTFAYILAKIQEENLNLTKKTYISNVTHSPNPSILKTPNTNHFEAPKQVPKTTLPIQKINQNQMKECRENGLCYYCESK